jgi:solute carrier family 25 citrate transporter 1
MQGLDAHKYRSTMHCVSEILKNEGVLAFYKGTGPRLTRVCCEVGITMSLYGEVVKLVRAICECIFSLNTHSFFILLSHAIIILAQ